MKYIKAKHHGASSEELVEINQDILELSWDYMTENKDARDLVYRQCLLNHYFDIEDSKLLSDSAHDFDMLY